MAFHFTLAGIECRCDTPDELRSVLTGSKPKGKTRAKGTKGARAKGTNGANGHEANGHAANGHAANAAILELPLLEGPLDWDRVKKVGKKLKRKDTRTLRSELKQRQDLAIEAAAAASKPEHEGSAKA